MLDVSRSRNLLKHVDMHLLTHQLRRCGGLHCPFDISMTLLSLFGLPGMIEGLLLNIGTLGLAHILLSAPNNHDSKIILFYGYYMRFQMYGESGVILFFSLN